MRGRTQAGQPGMDSPHILWMGDFNRHHPMWDESCNAHLFTRSNLDKAQLLIDAAAKLGLRMVLPKDLPTLCALATGNYIRPDNMFTSDTLADVIVSCTTVPG